MITHKLPADDELDIDALTRIFNDTTNCYKYLFFRSLLSLIEQEEIRNDGKVSLEQITVSMLVLAWPITAYYRLSLGPQDQLSLLINQLQLSFESPNFTVRNTLASLERKVRTTIGDADIKAIQRYVPYRLLRPFYESETRGLPDHQKNTAIQACAEEAFQSKRPPIYRLSESGKYIELHHRWLNYLRRHRKILSDWSDWHLNLFLQRHNPNSPSISNKLYLPTKRKPLKQQQEMWIALMSRQQVRCIYSNEVIKKDRIHLDHFMPWSFICHDEPWNLVPVTQAANSAKGNCIPSSSYLDTFIDLQYRALAAYKLVLQEKRWETFCCSYVAGLRLKGEELMNRALLSRSFKETIQALSSIAKRDGFSGDWVYHRDAN